MNATVTEKVTQASNLNDEFDRHKIFAVVVTFYPDESVIENVRNTLQYYPFVVVVDNTGLEQSKRLLSGLLETERVEVVNNSNNVGIAEALNHGAEKAFDLGATWVSTFDQDSWLAVDYLSMIESYLQRHSNKERSHIFGCEYIDPLNVDVIKESVDCTGNCFEPADEVITSGMTFSLKTWFQLNGFDSRLFIDFVDHDFCAKANVANVNCLITRFPVLVHSLGNQSYHRLLWKGIYTSNHSSLRRYYMARNTVEYVRRYLVRLPRRALFHCRQLLRDHVVILLFEKNKMEKISAQFKGVVDGFRRKLGQV